MFKPGLFVLVLLKQNHTLHTDQTNQVKAKKVNYNLQSSTLFEMVISYSQCVQFNQHGSV